MKILTPIILFLCLLIYPFMDSTAQTSSIVNPDLVDIPYEKFQLENGLTLIVHEDKKAPIVAVNVWYHVGSKNEKVGKSGFAHLFEHLMFNGSEHFNKDYFQALESIGATDLNGTTNNDRTNYFQNVPTAALDQVLWLESDRMGHLLGVIDQERLDEQRGVVQNEKRQGENQPYGKQWNLITEAMYPQGHPYSWTVIGEMDHLNAASLEDVQDWFKTYYGAANAVIVVAGDVEANDIHEKIKHYFGHIESGPTLVRPQVNIPRRTGETRSTYEDRVPESRIVMVWNTPEWGTKEADYLDLATSILGSGKNSRLYKKLVYEDQVASSAFAFTWTKEISGNLVVGVNIKPGADVDKVEASVNDILMDFIKNGPTQAELDRVKAQTFAGKIKGLERIGGFGGKSDILAENMVFGGSPDFYKKGLETLATATIDDIKSTCQEWLMDGKHVLIANPFPKYGKGKSLADRNRVPEVGPAKSASFPEIQQRTLKNGMKVMLAQRPDVPTVVMNMMFDAGYSTDQMTSPGTASLAMNLLDEGTKNLNALQISEQLDMLGAGIGSYSDLDMSYISLNTLKGSLEESLDLYADVIINPAFPQAEFDRLKKEQLNNIKREKSIPIQMAIRSFPKFLYGEDHPYSQPLTGSGYENTVEKLQKSDLEKFHSDFIRPNNATLVVVGDITMDELETKLEQRFKSWKKGNTPKKEFKTVEVNKGNKLYLMDRAESSQSVIISGYLTYPYGDVSEVGTEAMVNVFGGDFTSRINMNLREDKHWSYGSRAIMLQAKEQRPFIIYAPVQTDKTSESIEEIVKEFNSFVSDKPMTQAEFEKNMNNTVLQLPGQWETNSAISNSMQSMVKYDLPDDYYEKYEGEVRNLKLNDIQNLSKKIVKSEQLNWFVVGDRQKVLPNLQKLGFDEIIVVDGDGNVIEKVPAVVKP